ncbi:MAG TPA: ADOP family duplicated permease, partial [Bryobacteraceae bacterium]|nr:ADOP family duplicated permease [Bryobacteraceae bacterium]
MSELLRKLRHLLYRARFERELEEEMRHHLALMANERGCAQFGNIALLKENSRAMWTWTFWEQFAQDLRYGIRSMSANKLFTAMAVLSLALGIGANTAIYSFMDAIFVRSLPVRHPEQLLVLGWHSAGRPGVVHGVNGSMFRDGKSGSMSPNFPYAAYRLLREQKNVLSTLFAYATANRLNVVARNQAEVARGLYVSGNFYAGLGVTPAAGRLIGEDDDRPGASPVAVLTYRYWQSRFASDPAAVGRTISINDVPFTIVGVSAPGFFGLDSSSDPAVFMPLRVISTLAAKPADDEKRRFYTNTFYWVEMMGRAQPGVSTAQAETVLASQFHSYAISTAENEGEKKVLPWLIAQEGAGGLDSLRRQYSKPLYVLMAMVGLILTIACANIANLLLARATARRREIAIRLSLGASRLRVVRQLLTESLLLSLTGGILGLLIALWGIRSIAWLLSDGREGFTMPATLNLPVLGFTFALAAAAGILFGLVPALQATGANVAPALKESRIASSRGRSRFSLSRILIVTQISISLLLVIAAGLFVRTLSNLHSVTLGFNRENILLFSLNARQAGYKDAALARFYENLGKAFQAIPGVRSAGLSAFPLAAGYWDDEDIVVPGAPAVNGKKQGSCVVIVNEAFLPTMQIPVLLGRQMQARDMDTGKVAIVTQQFAKKFFPNLSPLGRYVGIGSKVPADIRIIGVAKNSIYN